MIHQRETCTIVKVSHPRCFGSLFATMTCGHSILLASHSPSPSSPLSCTSRFNSGTYRLELTVREHLSFKPIPKLMALSLAASNLLVIPAAVTATINMFICTWFFEKINQRWAYGAWSQIWTIPCLIALKTMPWGAAYRWAWWLVITILIGYPYPHAMQVAWCSRISNSVRTRTISAAVYNMLVQAHGIISANVYRAEDAPEYRRGNSALIGVAVLNICIYVGARIYYTRRNRSRERSWNAMSPEQQKHYLKTTSDEGNKRLDFRFVS
jgi:hypothetical protein